MEGEVHPFRLGGDSGHVRLGLLSAQLDLTSNLERLDVGLRLGIGPYRRTGSDRAETGDGGMAFGGALSLRVPIGGLMVLALEPVVRVSITNPDFSTANGRTQTRYNFVGAQGLVLFYFGQ
jgi:hypothetical protein